MFLLSTGKCTFSLVTFVVELELMLLVSGRKAWELEREGCKALEQTNPESLNTLEVFERHVPMALRVMMWQWAGLTLG